MLIRASHEGSRRAYGSPRVLTDLIEQGIPITRKRVARLMQAEGLRARVRKRFRSTTMAITISPSRLISSIGNSSLTAPTSAGWETPRNS